MGKSADKFIDDKNIIINEITYFLNKEPESIFVAEENKKIIGYVLGCLDSKKQSNMKEVKRIILNYLKAPFMTRKDRYFVSSRMKMLFFAALGIYEEAKFKTPENAGTFHINLLREARGKGVGTKLMASFCKYVKSKGVKTIYGDSFQTKLNPNTNFWLKNGFKEYSRIKANYWNGYYPNEKIDLVCFYKKL